MDKDSPILARFFKEEAEMEIWKKTRDGEFALLKTYPICRWSGDLGPKIKEGDRQAPEGFYTITPGQMNPNSNYYLAFNTGYPNAFDRAWGHTGSELMVHGDCSSRGCYAMTDEQIQEIYALARESFFGGQKEFQFEAFPFRMTALNMAKHRNNPNFAFWKRSRKATKFRSHPPGAESRGLREALRVRRGGAGKFVAAAQVQCARQMPGVPARPGRRRRGARSPPARAGPDGQLYRARRRHGAVRVGDGGMNPVFASKLGTPGRFDNNGRLFQVATAPGALPRTPNPPAAAPPARGDGERADAAAGAASQGRRSAARTAENDREPNRQYIRRLEGASSAGREPDGRLARQQYRDGGEAEATRRVPHRFGAGGRACQDDTAEPVAVAKAMAKTTPPVQQARKDAAGRAGNAHRLLGAAGAQQRPADGRAAGGSRGLVREPLDRAALTRAAAFSIAKRAGRDRPGHDGLRSAAWTASSTFSEPAPKTAT